MKEAIELSEPKLISPLLDHFAMGDPISEHSGIRTCPAMDQQTGDKFIVKIISNPANPSQLEALLLTGAYADREQALNYYKDLSADIVAETEVLNKLAALDGFVGFTGTQIVEAEDNSGFDVYLLSPYRKSLERHWRNRSITHLEALNLGLDLCSALSVCRRSGYLYVATKPENIYLAEDGSFKLGDIGFISMSALKWASFPDRYRSAYTAPEIADAFAAINTTVDVYAIGLILYQAFNGGQLPDTTAPEIPSPEFADYEMAEIILKACAANPDDRWQDPMEMGQALVGYMQRNGAHDTPIVPVVEAPAEQPVVEEVAAECDTTPQVDEENPTAAEAAVSDVAEEQQEAEPAPEEMQNDGQPENDASEEIPEETPVQSDTPEAAEEPQVPDSDTVATAYNEDDLGNLSFLSDAEDDTVIDVDPNADDSYAQISVEVSDILSQADALIAHETPDPVIQPEPIDVQLPPATTVEEAIPAEDTAENEIPQPETDGEAIILEGSTDTTPDDTETEGQVPAGQDPDEAEPLDDFYDDDDELLDYEPAKKSSWLRNTLLILLGLCVLACGFLFYKFYYLQNIDSLKLIGSDYSLTVQIKTNADESLLNVVCYDTYGNQLQAPVVNGTAVFEELAPDCAYTVKVTISGFHSLTGKIASSYATPKQTSIAQFSAITGPENGSAIVNFTVDGPDLDSWILRCSAADEETQEFTLTDHTYTITGLTVGKAYTFELLPTIERKITGTTVITHAASNLVSAEQPYISSCIDGKLTVNWSVSQDVQVESWTVHCFNEKGYDQTIQSEELNATFEGIVTNDPYTVEITAKGMSVGQRVYVPENAVTISNLNISATDATSLTLSWTNGSNTPAKGWILQYSIDGSSIKEVKSESADSVVVTPYIPDAVYSFTLLTADSADVIGGKLTYESKKAEDFSGYGIKKSNLNFKMCRTPSVANWTKNNLSSADYMTSFKPVNRASFLVSINRTYKVSSDKIYVTYVIRDTDGTVVNFSTTETKWKNMWSNGYGEFDLPTLPQTAGNYTVTVYFNDALACQQNFRIK